MSDGDADDGVHLPTISIVTPTLNHARFIEQMLHSIHDQNYPHLEHIVVDGGSCDGTVEILKRWEHRLAWWTSEPDQGMSHALNKGFVRATGEVRGYLNSDDYYHARSLWHVGKYFAAHADAALVHGYCNVVDDNGGSQRRHLARIGTYAELLDLWGVWFQKRNFVQPEVFWRHDAAPGEFDESLHFAMDYDYWVRMLRNGASVHTLNEQLAYFRLVDNQKSAQWQAVAAELHAVVARALWSDGLALWPRLRLQGDWYYSGEFMAAVERAERDGLSRAQRYMALLGLCLKRPQLLLSRLLRERVRQSLLLGP